jgi:hypothetical protein
MFFTFYLLIGVIFYLDFMQKLEEVGGFDNIRNFMGDDWAKGIDFNSPGSQFITFLICVILWPIFLITSMNNNR